MNLKFVLGYRCKFYFGFLNSWKYNTVSRFFEKLLSIIRSTIYLLLVHDHFLGKSILVGKMFPFIKTEMGLSIG